MSHPTTPSRTTIPEREVVVDKVLVTELLQAQHPDLADRHLEIVAEGWDNIMVRCGDDLAVRLPRRALGASILETELRWLPHLAPHLPVATPVAVGTGHPTENYPWTWAIVPWIEGTQASDSPPDPSEVVHFADILSALHGVPDADTGPRNPYRGGPLARHVDRTRSRLERLADFELEHGLDIAALGVVFQQGVDAPPATTETWLHGDCHPHNIIVDGGSITGLIDWGDMCSGDPATDLASVWMLFSPEHHEAFWDVYQPTKALRDRARAWTVAFGSMLFDAGLAGDAGLERSGRWALQRVVGSA